MRRNWKRSAWLLAEHLVLLPSVVAIGLNGGDDVHLVLRLPDYLPEIEAHPQARLLFSVGAPLRACSIGPIGH